MARRKQDYMVTAQQQSPNGHLRLHKRTLCDLSAQENGERLCYYTPAPSSSYHNSGSKPLVLRMTNKLRAHLRILTKCWRNVDVSGLTRESSAGRGEGYGGGVGGGSRRRGRGTSQAITFMMCGAVLLWLGSWLSVQLYSTLTLQQPLIVTVGPGVTNSRHLVVEKEFGLGVSSRESKQNSPAAADDDIGPTLAYGIMVYQRKGYAVEKTLGQFKRMFDAMYDEHNM